MRLPQPQGTISNSLFDYINLGPQGASSLIVRICEPSNALNDADFSASAPRSAGSDVQDALG